MESEKQRIVSEIVDKKFSEWEKRIDYNLAEKLIAIEKLFNVTIGTRSDAISVAVNRMQADNRDNCQKCDKQVGIFYTHINKIREDALVNSMKIDMSEGHIEEITKEQKDIAAKLAAIEEWKKNFWVNNLVKIVVVSCCCMLALFKFFTWIIDFLSKVNIG